MRPSSLCAKPLLLLLLLAAAVAAVSAEPCIECQYCSTDNCYSTCQKSCAVDSPPPSPEVPVNDCEGYGRIAGASVAQTACDSALRYCEGTYLASAVSQALNMATVSLTQCENVAYGVCQSTATDSSSSPCGYAFAGYQQCGGDDFMNFYRGEVNELCEKRVQDIAP